MEHDSSKVLDEIKTLTKKIEYSIVLLPKEREKEPVFRFQFFGFVCTFKRVKNPIRGNGIRKKKLIKVLNELNLLNSSIYFLTSKILEDMMREDDWTVLELVLLKAEIRCKEALKLSEQNLEG